MNILIIPENFRNDQYILKPIFEAMMRYLGRPKTKVLVCRDPLLGGVDQALDWTRIQEVLERYKGMIDIFVLCIDRDGKVGRRTKLDTLENLSNEHLKSKAFFIGDHAIEELEVWLLAGHKLLADWKWKNIRQEINPKEVYYLPFAQAKGVLDQPYEGRKSLSILASKNYSRIRSLCNEDLGNIETRLAAVIQMLEAF